MKNKIVFAFLILFSCTSQKKDDVFQLSAVDSPPEFDGGLDVFYQYLKGEISNPNVGGSIEVMTLFCSFVVNKEGKVEQVKIVKGISESFDKTVIEALLNSETWTPGSIDGKSVSVYMELPFKFPPKEK